MRTIGIYTFWNVPNYGTFMQAYALQKWLQFLYPRDDIRQIAYLDPVHYRMYYSLVNTCFRYHLINPHFYKDVLRRWKQREGIAKLKKFLQYYEKYIPHFAVTDDAELKKLHFDCVVLGSDIIWDFTIPCFHQDPQLFGLGFQADQVISYAPSFGTVKMGMRIPDYVRNGLVKMNHVSVRDSNSEQLVNHIVGG